MLTPPMHMTSSHEWTEKTHVIQTAKTVVLKKEMTRTQKTRKIMTMATMMMMMMEMTHKQ